MTGLAFLAGQAGNVGSTGMSDAAMKPSLERALSELESRLASASKAAKSALDELKRAHNGARLGQMRDLSKSLAEGREAARRFAEEMTVAAASWTFEAEPYLADGGYLEELLLEADRAGLKLFER